MKLVVDTNIIFSGLLSPVGTISDLLINSSGKFKLFSPTTILEELDNHETKIYQRRILLNGSDRFRINKYFNTYKSYRTHQRCDEFDAPFIALALDLKCTVWTGDKNL